MRVAIQPALAVVALAVACLWGVALRALWQNLFRAGRTPGEPYPWDRALGAALVLGFGLWSMMLTIVGALGLGAPLVLGSGALLRSLGGLLLLHAGVFLMAPRMPRAQRAQQRVAVLLAMAFSAGCTVCQLYLFRQLQLAPPGQLSGTALTGVVILVLSVSLLSYRQAGKRWRGGVLTGMTYWTMVMLGAQAIQWPDKVYYLGARSVVTLTWLATPLSLASLIVLSTTVLVAWLRREHQRLAEAPPASPPLTDAEVDARAEGLIHQMLDERRQRDALYDKVLRHAKVRFWSFDAEARQYRLQGGMGPDDTAHEDVVADADTWREDCLHPQERAAMMQEVSAQLASQGSFDHMHRLRTSRDSENWRWVIARGVVVERNAAGQPSRMVGTHMDVTEQKELQAALDRDGRLFSDGQVVMIRWIVDVPTGRMTALDFVSPNVDKLWGYPLEQIYAMPSWRPLVPIEDMSRLDRKIRVAMASNTHEITHEFRLNLKGGRVLWHSLFAHVETQGGQGQLTGFIVDIDSFKRAEQRTQEQARQLEELVRELQRAKDETAILRESSEFLNSAESLDEAFHIISRAAQSIFPGWSGALASAVEADRLKLVGRWGDAQEFTTEFASADCWSLRRSRTHQFVDEGHSLRCRHVHLSAPPGRSYLCVPMSANGETVGSLHLMAPDTLTQAQMTAMSRRAVRLGETLRLALSNLRLREGLREQATHDGLTGLYNRRFMNDRLPVEIKRCEREGQHLALAMIDVDHFKQFNDQYGHEAGDAVLRALGNLMRARSRVYDLACRYGGEEIALIMPGCTLLDATEKMESLRQQVAALTLTYNDAPLPRITVSIGLADTLGGDPATLIKRADERLYMAKRSGRNRVVTAWTDALDPQPSQPA